MRLAGHHAVITGGGTGIGAAIAAALAREGARLTLVGRRRDKLKETARELLNLPDPGFPELVEGPFFPSSAPVEEKNQPSTSSGKPELRVGATNISSVAADLTDRAQVDAAFAAARQANGPISILINNAGAATSAPFDRLTAEQWRAAMAVNLDALLHTCQSALPDLLAAPAGRIVTIASTAGLKGYAYSAAYTAAKHGAVGLTRALAAEFAKTNLTVNAVCPGFTDTDLVAEAVATIRDATGRTDDEARTALARFNPQGRLVTPQEVADAVLWLCLPESRSITGQAIAVAGGEVM